MQMSMTFLSILVSQYVIMYLFGPFKLFDSSSFAMISLKQSDMYPNEASSFCKAEGYTYFRCQNKLLAIFVLYKKI